MKCLPNLGINNKEKPLCFGYSVKARALLFAHLSRVPLPKLSLHQDRLYIVKKCPYLIHEMVSCISQLILLAHAGRIARLPSLDTVEATMKCSSLVVQVSSDILAYSLSADLYHYIMQALWDKASPLLQLLSDTHCRTVLIVLIIFNVVSSVLTSPPYIVGWSYCDQQGRV